MNSRLLNIETKKVIYDSDASVNIIDEANIKEEEHHLISDSFDYGREEICLEGIQISYNKVYTHDKCEFIFDVNNDNIMFIFCLEGELKYSNQGSNIFSSLRKDKYSVIQINSNHYVLRFDETTKFICLQFSKELYYKLTGTDSSHNFGDFSSLNLYPEVNLILSDLFNKKISQKIKKIYLEAKIYDLLILFITKAEQKQTFLMKQDDIDKILMAKQHVESNIQTPYSLIELSRKVGINDYKLKKGFKEITGNTVFGYLYEIRMKHAFYLLSNEQKSVNEVAFLVGYKNAQHFTAAFKKKYNVLPGNLNRLKNTKA